MSVITTTACARGISQGYTMLPRLLLRGYAVLLLPYFELHLPERRVIHMCNSQLLAAAAALASIAAAVRLWRRGCPRAVLCYGKCQV